MTSRKEKIMPVMTDPSVVIKLTPALLEMMKAEGTIAAGLGQEAAAAQLGFKFVEGVGFVKTYTTTASAVGSAVTAGEAIAGAGAATGAAESASVTATLVTAADGTTKIMGLGTIALEAGAVVLAGAAGYMAGDAIGDLIDSKYPEFFDGLFSTVSEFLTGDEHGLAFLFDSDGHAYMDEKSVSKVNEYIANLPEFPESYVTLDGVNLYFTKARVNDCYGVYNGSSSTGLATAVFMIESFFNDTPVYAYSYRTPNNGDSVFTRLIKVDDGSNSMFNQKFYNIDHDFYGTFTKPRATGVSYKKGELVHYRYTTSSIYKNSYLSYPVQTISDETAGKLADFEREVLFGKVNASGINKPDLKKYEVPKKPTITVGDKTYTRVPLPEPTDDPTKVPTKIPVLEPEEKPEPEKIPQYIYVPLPTPTPAPTPLPSVDPSTEPEPLPDIDPVKPIPRPPVPTPTPTPQPPLPVPPPISSEATGLLHVYNPTNSEINEFGAWLWTTFSGDLIDTLGKLFNNPMEAVIGLHELYCTPITGESVTIKAGFLDSGVTSRLVAKRYTEINCGALVVPEHWGNYLDYTPYTKVYCYLPFIGIVELNADDIIGHGVQVVYKIDSYNGSCIAMIITAKTPDVEVVKYQFSGNCAVEVPITSGMKSAMQSALIGAGTCAIGAAIGGAAIPVIAGMSVNTSVKSGFSNKNTVSHSGSFGSSYGAMGIKKPYIIVKRPIQKVVNGYNEKYGYPAHEMVTIGKCSGYLRCRDFDVQSSTATEDEKKLIETLLKQGVYV